MMIPSWIDDGSEIPDPFGHGERAVQWIRKNKHFASALVGRAFQLDHWQERIIRRLYGPRDKNGNMIVRRLILLLPRGNRKTSLCAIIMLLHLIGPERVPGNLIVSAASAREQARELFEEAAKIILHDRRLSKHLDIRDYTSTIHFKKDRSRYIAVSSEGKVLHGKTPRVVIADELHAWEGRAGQVQWEALTSALVKVPNTLMIVATTSGRGQENLAWKTVEHAIKVQKGEIDDPSTLPVIFMAEEGDDWKSEDTWHALNPGMKHGYPDIDGYRDKAKLAIASPGERDSFLQYNLNRWLDHSYSAFVEMSVYDRGAAPLDLGALKGRDCWLGIDPSSTTDLTAVVAAFRDDDGGFTVLPHFFCPGDNLRRRANKDGVPYSLWAEQGLITPTPGDAIDYSAVVEHVRKLADDYDIREIGIDSTARKYAQPIVMPLQEDGFDVVDIPQGWFTQSPALNVLERAIVSGQFRHGGHAVLRWNFSNVSISTDPAGNRKADKGKATDRIDGFYATWMAVARAAAGESNVSQYNRPESNGLFIF
jgi:phage terminase large subunit-like protein